MMLTRSWRYRFACWLDNRWTDVIILSGYPDREDRLTRALWRVERGFFWFVRRWAPLYPWETRR